MWMALFWVVVVIGFWALFTWLIIRADTKDQKAHDAWYNHPDQVWNLWKKEK